MTPPADLGPLDLSRIAQDLQIRKEQVRNVVQLLDEGNTVPFITRYRKEKTGELNEEVLRIIQERVGLLRQLAERKQTILRSIENQGKLTDDLRAAIHAADNPKRLEDLYLPYKPKKRTLASAAREKGLEPLALAIWYQDPAVGNLSEMTAHLVDPAKELHTPDDVLFGVQHILAEIVAEAAEVRAGVRAVLWDTGRLVTTKSEKLAEGQGLDYKDYFEFAEPVRLIPPHRTLAINRGEKENALTVKFDWDSQIGLRVAFERLPLPEPGTLPPLPPPPVAAEATPAEAPAEATPAAETPSIPAPVAESQTGATEAAPTEPTSDAPAPAVAPPPARPGRPRPAPATIVPLHGGPNPNRGELLANHPHADFLRHVTEDALMRLLVPSLEREIRRELTHRAEDHAVGVFARNLRSKLLAPPLRGKRILAIDPGFRTGCKLAVLDETGNLLEDGVIYPHTGGQAKKLEARIRLEELLRRYQVSVIAIGNGTACRETEEVVSELLANLDARRRGEVPPPPTETPVAPPSEAPAEPPVVAQTETPPVAVSETPVAEGTPATPPSEPAAPAAPVEPPAPPPTAVLDGLPEALPELAYIIVNEAGASVYSASPVGREEFPNFDATLRGTISIGRRLQDPLSELVKIDPQHVGVGLYQHDVNPRYLRESLEGVIESSVNTVGVDLNTASVPLLRHVSGLNQLVARDLVEYRKNNGLFRTREQLMQVNGIGDARYVQAAGFLKILDGDNPLDRTWIHPENYAAAHQILADLGFGPEALADRQKVEELREKIKGLAIDQLAERLQLGIPTVRDILESLARPGRDPREDLPPPVFKKGILKLEDLQPGMELKGTVLNVVDFGAFIDIGLKDSGLVHISQMANRYVKIPYDIVAVGDVVTVWVLLVDKERRRVSLSMIAPGTERKPPERRPPPRRGARGPDQQQREPGQEQQQRPPQGQGERPQGERQPAERGGDRPPPPRRDGPPPQRGDRPPPRRDGPPRGDRPPPPRGPARPPQPVNRPQTPRGQTRRQVPQRGPAKPGEAGAAPPPEVQQQAPAEGQQAGAAPAPVPAAPTPPKKAPRRQPPKLNLSQSALEGASPLGTFAELAAFWQAKKKEDEPTVAPAVPPEGKEGEAPSEPPPSPPA